MIQDLAQDVFARPKRVSNDYIEARWHQRNDVFCRFCASHEPTIVIEHPDDWNRAYFLCSACDQLLTDGRSVELVHTFEITKENQKLVQEFPMIGREIAKVCARGKRIPVVWMPGGEFLTQRHLVQPGSLQVNLVKQGVSADCHDYLIKHAPIPIDDVRVTRAAFRLRYSYSIPTAPALDAIAEHSKGGLIDCGAGNGYWGLLLRRRGVAVTSVDVARVDFGTNKWFQSIGRAKAFYWSEVEIATSLTKFFAAADRSERTMLLSWPPPSGMALEALTLFRGDKVIYVGTRGEECASREFFATLSEDWEVIRTVELPSFLFVGDVMTIYKRKGV